MSDVNTELFNRRLALEDWFGAEGAEARLQAYHFKVHQGTDCWCQPVVSCVDPVTDDKVYTHKEES